MSLLRAPAAGHDRTRDSDEGSTTGDCARNRYPSAEKTPEQTADGALSRGRSLSMSNRRALLGGLGLIVGAVPLVVTYGFQSFGLVGVVLAAFGAVVSFGAYRYNTV